MPCGGITPCTPQPRDRCWVCNEGGTDHFIEEWDAGLHYRCLGKFLSSDEGQVILDHGHVIFAVSTEKELTPSMIREDRNPEKGSDWYNRVVVVWEEDDAMVPDREMGTAAFARIAGTSTMRGGNIDEYDGGDTIMTLYRGGWVRGASCGLAFVGHVAKIGGRR